jgi:hypothetical protein
LNQPSRKSRAGAIASGIRSNPAPPSTAEGAPSAAEPAARDPAAPALSPPPPFDPRDPASVDRWLEAARAALLDLVAVAREGARRPRKRVLSRGEMRRQARDAFAKATALVDLAAGAMRHP